MPDYSHLPTTASEQRARLRRSFRNVRKQISAKEQQQMAHDIVTQIKRLDLLKQVNRVAIYLTNDGELNTQALIEYLWQLNIEVYLPVLHPFSHGHLLFLRYTDNTPMRKNKYGIDEPVLDCSQIGLANQLDIIFAPLVAFDEKGNRLGMGGGFYDRTFERLGEASLNLPLQHNTRAKTHPTKLIGLAYDAQKALSLPIEVWDIPLPYILTPTRLYQF